MRGNTHVYVSELGNSKPMFLPWYYIEDERLMLYSFEFRIPNLLIFDFDKKPLRYVAVRKAFSFVFTPRRNVGLFYGCASAQGFKFREWGLGREVLIPALAPISAARTCGPVVASRSLQSGTQARLSGVQSANQIGDIGSVMCWPNRQRAKRCLHRDLRR